MIATRTAATSRTEASTATGRTASRQGLAPLQHPTGGQVPDGLTWYASAIGTAAMLPGCLAVLLAEEARARRAADPAAGQAYFIVTRHAMILSVARMNGISWSGSPSWCMLPG